MAHKTLINGTAYDITGGKTLIDGTGRKIAKGRTLVNGTGYDILFVKEPNINLTWNCTGVYPDSNYFYVTINGVKYLGNAAVYAPIGSEVVFYFDDHHYDDDETTASSDVRIDGVDVGSGYRGYTWTVDGAANIFVTSSMSNWDNNLGDWHNDINVIFSIHRTGDNVVTVTGNVHNYDKTYWENEELEDEASVKVRGATCNAGSPDATFNLRYGATIECYAKSQTHGSIKLNGSSVGTWDSTQGRWKYTYTVRGNATIKVDGYGTTYDEYDEEEGETVEKHRTYGRVQITEG